MEKFKVTIEEHYAQTFDIEAADIEEAMEIAENDYNNGFMPLKFSEINGVCMMAENEDGTESTEWVEI